MANIIDNKKIRKIAHRFDTAENWKKSNVQLLPGEIAFDDEGNFKVGLNQDDNSWRSLPFAGKAKFVSGTLEERPSILDAKSYGVGDIFKDTTSNKWYFLTGYDGYGEYIWEEITFGSHDLDSVVESFEAKLAEKANVSALEDLRIELADKISKEDLQDLATKEELIAVGEMTEEVIDSVEDLSRKMSSVEDNIIELSAKLEDTVSTEDLHSYAESLAAMVDEKANKRDLLTIESSLREKADLSTVEDNFVRREAFDSVFDDTESLKELIATKADKEELTSKVDNAVLFDENGIIRSSLLPGSVDDIVEGVLADTVFIPQDRNAQINVGGKLYLDVNTKMLYRWSGTQYVNVSSGNSSLVLGTTSGTAYEGSSGKALEETVKALQDNVSNSSSEVSSQGMRLSSIEEDLANVVSDVNAHTKSLATIEANVVSQNTKIADIQADVKTHTNTLATHDKNIATLQNNLNTVQTTVSSMQSSINKVSQFESKLNTLEKNISSQTSSIETLSYTVNAQGNALTEQIAKIARLEAVSDTIEGLSDTISKQDDKITSVADTVNSYSDRISVLESNESTQDTRLGAIEEKLVEHVADIAALKTSAAYQKVQLEKLEDAIENIVVPEVDLSTIIDENGLIKSSLLPGYVDDVIEGVITEDGFIPAPMDSSAEAEIGVSGKLYVDINTKDVYRWSGSQYVKVSSGKTLVLGTTEGTAYEGSAGKELETIVATHNTTISSLQKKVNDLLSIDLPSGETLTLGTLAFKDTISADDITSVNLSQIILDDELELYGGDSSD
jgi:uncharacterized coiled-coil protein SlyX